MQSFVPIVTMVCSGRGWYGRVSPDNATLCSCLPPSVRPVGSAWQQGADNPAGGRRSETRNDEHFPLRDASETGS